jgi:hypothetical protein
VRFWQGWESAPRQSHLFVIPNGRLARRNLLFRHDVLLSSHHIEIAILCKSQIIEAAPSLRGFRKGGDFNRQWREEFLIPREGAEPAT